MTRLELWAHRGSHRKDGPLENTLPAFAEALESGAHGIELDVHLSVDGVAIVHHDVTTKRLSAENWTLNETPWAKLATLPLKGGFRIPPLSVVLQLIGARMPVNIEIKDGEALPAVLEAVAAVPELKVEISSFNADALVEALKLAPQIPRSLAMETLPLRGADAFLDTELERTQAWAWHPNRFLLNDARIQRILGQDRMIRVWTINSAKQALALADRGVTGIFTDTPGALII